MLELFTNYGHSDQDRDGTPGTFSIAQGADRLAHYIEGSRTTIANAEAYRAAGFAGPIWLYLIGSAQDPGSGSLYGNQLVRSFDDYAGLPPEAFLYSDQERKTRLWWDGGGGRRYYRTDPANGEVTELYAKTIGDSLTMYPSITGMFIDNIGEIKNLDPKGPVYPGSPSIKGDGATAGTPYTREGFALMEQMLFRSVRALVPEVLLVGNMLYSPTEVPWWSFDMFDGLFDESLAGWTNSNHFFTTEQLTQRLAAWEDWLVAENRFLLLMHQITASTNDDAQRYGQALALMAYPTQPTITLGGQTMPRWAYRPAASGAYKRWLEFNDLSRTLGPPLSAPTVSADGLFERPFSAGPVRANTGTKTVGGLPPRSASLPAADYVPTEPPPETTDPPPIVVETEDTTVTVTVEIDPKGDGE